MIYILFKTYCNEINKTKKHIPNLTQCVWWTANIILLHLYACIEIKNIFAVHLNIILILIYLYAYIKIKIIFVVHLNIILIYLYAYIEIKIIFAVHLNIISILIYLYACINIKIIFAVPYTKMKVIFHFWKTRSRHSSIKLVKNLWNLCISSVYT